MGDAKTPFAFGPEKKKKQRSGPYDAPKPNPSAANATSSGAKKKVEQLHYCEICKISCVGPESYQAHINGKKHKKHESTVSKTTKSDFYCTLCSIDCQSDAAHVAHLKGAKHQRALKLHTRLGKPEVGAMSTAITGNESAKKSVWDIDEFDV